MSGFTKSFRSKWTHPVFRSLLEAGIWSWMCDTAAWKKTKVRHNGVLVDLERGQLVTSIRFISQGFQIGEQVTRTFLENLEKEGMCNTQTNTRGTIITICNYEKYQSMKETDNEPDNEAVTDSQQTANTNKKEVNKDKNKRSNNKYVYTPEFLEFWAVYPKREAKQTAQEAYAQAAEKVGHEKILAGAKAFSEVSKGKDIQYLPHPATWLNAGRWDDEYHHTARKTGAAAALG